MNLLQCLQVTDQKVTVLDIFDNFLPRDDEDISKLVRSDLESRGIIFKLGVKIVAITDNSVEIINKEGKKVSILSDKNFWLQQVANPILLDLDLKNTNIQLGQRGEIVVNDKLETTVQKCMGTWGMCMAVYNLLTLPLMISVL